MGRFLRRCRGIWQTTRSFPGPRAKALMEQKPYDTAPLLDAVPWLVHGFGRAGFGEADLARGERSGFRPVLLRQVHSDIVHVVGSAPDGRLTGDALVTGVPGLLLVVRTADCLPVFLVDEANRAVAAVHCGWRGTKEKVLARAVEVMSSTFGSDPAGLLAAFGPAIGRGCYEVGAEVTEAFLKAGFPPGVFSGRPGRPDKFLLDLVAANLFLLRLAGLGESHVYVTDGCSHCRHDFYSYRRDPLERRRLHNLIGIRP